MLETVDSEILTFKYNKNKAAGVMESDEIVSIEFSFFNDLPFISTQEDFGLRGLRSYFFIQASGRRFVEFYHVFRGLLIKILVN